MFYCLQSISIYRTWENNQKLHTESCWLNDYNTSTTISITYAQLFNWFNGHFSGEQQSATCATDYYFTCCKCRPEETFSGKKYSGHNSPFHPHWTMHLFPPLSQHRLCSAQSLARYWHRTLSTSTVSPASSPLSSLDVRLPVLDTQHSVLGVQSPLHQTRTEGIDMRQTRARTLQSVHKLNKRQTGVTSRKSLTKVCQTTN